MKKKPKKPAKLIKPFVSICTPTFNRRPFIKSMIECFNHQTYPKDRMEWIIIDDGTDKIEDLVKNIPQVKYFSYDEQMVLGKKRNIMHEKSIGEILVYMDDDDYYPPERVSHAVEMLLSHPKSLCAGSSEMYIYFKHISKMYQFGPYGAKHGTAGTFAFKRELLKDHSYNNDHAIGEEKEFLKDYTVPFVQLEPKKTILVFSHIHNTFDKKILLQNMDKNPFVKESNYNVDEFIKEKHLFDFYMNIDNELEDYAAGLPLMKPKVLQQTKMIIDKRKQIEDNARKNNEKIQETNKNGKIVIEQNGNKIELDNNQIVDLLKKQQILISNLKREIDDNNRKMEKQNETIKLYIEKDISMNNNKLEILGEMNDDDNEIKIKVNSIN
jgi:glycosyltransferase involved in cell wall biosynthesis